MEALQKCVEAGQVNARTECGKTPLMTACYYCKKAMISYLIDSGAVVNATDELTGCTAAHYVVMSMVCL